MFVYNLIETKIPQMKSKLILLFAFFVALINQTAYSQSKDTLINRYRRIAVDYQQQVKMAKKSLLGAESKFKATKSAYGPKLDFSSNYKYYGVPMQLAPPADAPIGTPGEELHNIYSLDITLNQPVITGGNLKNTRKASEWDYESMKSYVKMSEQQVMLASDKTYLTVVAKKEINKLAEAYRDIIGEFVKVINNRVEEEVVGKNELYQSKVRYNDAEYQVLRSAKEYKMSLMNLNRLLGYPVDTVPLIADSLPLLNLEISSDSLIEKALVKRPDLSYYKGKVIANQYREKVTVSKFNPQMNVFAGGKWGSPAPGLQIQPDFNYYFAAKLKIPIFYWGEKKHEKFAVKQQTEISKLKVDETTDEIVLEAQQAYYNLMESKEQVNFAKGALDNAKKNVIVMLDRYNEGLSSVLEVLDAQTFWQKSYLNYIQAKYDLNIAYSEYLHATGELNK